MKADEGYMSQFQGRDSTVITLTTEPGTDYWEFFRDADAVLQEFEPRAHWGKIHFMTRQSPRTSLPGVGHFPPGAARVRSPWTFPQ